MRQLHLDIISGISGDMTAAALHHLGAPLEPVTAALAAMELGDVRLELAPVAISGIGALRFSVSEAGPARHHAHRSWSDIRQLLLRAGLPDSARRRAEAIFSALAEAEGRVHGRPADQVQFHEVGAVDSIADVVAIALGLDALAPERITSSPALLGHGITSSQHGPLPIPAPATVELLRGRPTRGLDIEAELTTPTGAAVLAAVVDEFSPWPDMAIERIGYGAGSRELPERPNLLRAVLGRAEQRASDEELLIEANIDDMNPEHFEHLIERLLLAGAHDVWLQPVVMKKSRPAVVISLLCATARSEALEGILFTESTTIGLRRSPVQRRKLVRRSETVETPWGPVRVKLAGEGDAIWTVAPEYADCHQRALAAGVPLKQIYQAACAAWERKRG